MATNTHTPPGTRRGGTATGCPAARPSRRDLMAAAGFSALPGIAALAIARPDAEAAEVLPAETHPDAELIGLCDRFLELERQWGALTDVSCKLDSTTAEYRRLEAEEDAIVRSQDPLVDRIYELPTYTLDGFRARAKAIMAGDHGEMERQQDHRGQLYSLMRDLVGEAI